MSTYAGNKILDEVIDALGGTDRLQKLESVHAAGRILYEVPGRFRICGKWRSWFTKQGQYREELDLPGENTRIRIFDVLSGRAWISPADGPPQEMKDVRPDKNVRPDVFRNAYLTSLGWLFPERVPAEFRLSQSKDHREVEITFKDIDGIRISINDSNKLPDQITWLKCPAKLRGCRHSAGLRLCGDLGGYPDIASEDSHASDAVALLSDWKKHDNGVRYPSRIRLLGGSSQEQTFTVDTFEVNIPIDTLFEMPKPSKRIQFTGKTQAARSVTIPFRLFDSKIVIDVFVNDHGPLAFIFDTGCATTIIDETLFKKLGLGSPCEFTKEAGSSDVKELLVADGVTFAVDELKLQTQNTLVAQISLIAETRLGLQVDGLLGGSFIQNFVTEIDYRLQTLTLSDSATYNWGNSKPIPMQVQSGLPFVEAKVGVRPIKGRMMVDTGSEWNIVFTKPFLDENGLTKKVKPSFETLVVTVAGDTKVRAGRLDEVSVGEVKVDKPIVALPTVAEGSFAADSFAGFLGADILSSYRVVFDYPGSQMTLIPSGRRSAQSDHDMSGLILIKKPKFMEVAFVIRGSPAAEADLRKGDLIEAINGVSTANWTMPEWSHINRNGGTYVFSVRRRKELLDPVKIVMRQLV